MSSDHLFADPLLLHSAASDLERLQRGWRPGDRILEQAPVLLDWSFQPVPVPALRGLCVGHPRLRGGPIVTSPLVAIDLENSRWARTQSRWYRLVNPGEVADG